MAIPSARREFAVTSPTTDPRLMIVLLVMLPELLALVVIVMLLRTHVPDAMQPSLFVHRLIALPLALIFACMTALLFWAARRRGISLIGDELDVTATFYRRKLPASTFDLGGARVINLDEHREWRPFIKTNGFGMPGLRAGWFRSRNWTSLFCLITDRQRVLLLPLRTGGALLLSAERPTELLDALRAVDDGIPSRR